MGLDMDRQRSLLYQKNWTDQFRDQSDAEFVVEGVVLSVHSLFFYELQILQGCFADTTNSGKPRIESCLQDMTVDDMNAFLCLIYRSPVPHLKLMNGRFLRLERMAAKLDCPSVVNFVVMELEADEDPSIDMLVKETPGQYELWFALIERLESNKLSERLAKFLKLKLSDYVGSRGDHKWTDLYAVPKSSLLSLIRELHLKSTITGSSQPFSQFPTVNVFPQAASQSTSQASSSRGRKGKKPSKPLGSYFGG